MKRKNLLFALLLALFMPWAANAQETVTVCDGTTTNSKIPVNGLYTDTQGTTSEFIIPADSLDVMEGGTISKVTFYISEIPGTWGSPVIQLYLGEVDGTTLSSLYGPSNFTVVKTMVWSNQQSTIEVEFDEPYTYEGGNLLIGTYVQTKGSYKTTNFYGVTGETGCSRYNNGSGTGTSQDFLPKTTFVYEPAQQGGDVCEKPATLVAENVTGNSATLTWTGGSGVYNIELNGTIIEENYEDYTYNLTDLAATTAYTAKVQSVCDGSTPTSTWKSVSFTTPCATYDIPYTYDFEEEAPFACWTPIAGVTRANSSSNAHNGSYYLRFAGSTSNLVALPQFNEATNNLRVEFWTRPESNTNSSCGTFSVGYMTDITDPSTFVEVANYAYNDWTSATYVKKAVDFINVPANANIAFRHNAGSSSWYWYADDVTVKEIPSCVAPTGLAANATITSAELSWTANSGETAWTVYYKKTTDESYTEVANVTANPYTLSGLDASSNYEFYVVANCSADDASEASEPFTFATACDVIDALGYSENFDGYTVASNYTAPSERVLPTCWNAINTTTYSTYTVFPTVYYYSYTDYSHSALNCLKFYSSYSSYTDYDPQPQYAILPEMENLAGTQITLYAKGYNASSTFKIGTMSDPTDASTFTMIAEQTLTTSYPTDPFEYLIPADCRDNYVAIMMEPANSSNTTRGVYVDDIVIREAPTCLKPTELAVTGVSTTTATLGWTNGAADQTAWQICLNGDEENLIMAERNPFTIEDLTAATSYTVKVRAYCGEDSQSDWSNEVNFATLCEAISTFPWTENFNSLTAGIPTCWDNSEGTTTALNYMWNYYASGHEGAGLRFNSYNNSNGLTNFLKTVSLSLPSDQLMQLSFWYKNPTGGDFSVYISTDGGATHETSLATDLTGVTTWTELVISLADYAGQEVVIVFKGTSNYGNGDAYIYLDDVTVMEVPTCLKPNGLEVTATTTTTATFSWTAGANETAWQICLNGDETNLIMAESNPFTVEGLTASTAYTAKVRAYCNADDQSDWSNEVSFATQCEAIVVDAANPFTEGFEGDWTPLCWESIPHIDGTTTRQWTTSSSNIHTGAGAAYSGFYGPIYLVMPDLQLGTDGNAAQLTFWSYNTYVNDYDKNSIVLLDGENEVELWSPESVNNSWEEVTIDLTEYMGQTISLAFKYEGNNAHGWYVDDVEVTMMKTFTKPIIGYDSAEGNGFNYYLIASPLADDVDPTTLGMITDDGGTDVTPETSTYDLYRFDQAEDAEWINYRVSPFNLVNGQGYLYASKEGITITFTGTPYSGTTKVVTLHKADDTEVDFPGWNLVGNPFGVTAYIDRGFYTLDGDGKEVVVSNSPSIEPMEGVFVVAEYDEEEMTFTTIEPLQGKKQIVLNLTQGRGNTIDRAIVRFGQSQMMPKFMLNENHTKMYIPKDNKDFAMVSGSNNGRLPVNFEPAEDGTYFINVDIENVRVKYLHLIDRETGMDVDLLQNPTYKFEAKKTEKPNRFELVFKTGSSQFKELFTSISGDNFSFCSNGEWIINNDGDAILQVIDINGQILSSESISGSVSKHIDATPGVYMLRLVNGENVKTQKIIIQ
jgi:hypothetical protein